jgi:ribosomal protein S27E
MSVVKVKILSVDVDCPDCNHNQNVDSSEFRYAQMNAFVEYETECDGCEKKYTFSLDVFN